MTSRPVSSTGIASRWTGVGSSDPTPTTALTKAAAGPSEANPAVDSGGWVVTELGIVLAGTVVDRRLRAQHDPDEIGVLGRLHGFGLGPALGLLLLRVQPPRLLFLEAHLARDFLLPFFETGSCSVRHGGSQLADATRGEVPRSPRF